MLAHWIAARDIPSGGTTYILDNADIWLAPAAEFGMQLRMREPLCAMIFVLPRENGFLVRGNLRGSVLVPCSRCTEDSIINIEQDFDSFEPFPGTTEGENEPEVPDSMRDESVVRISACGPEIDLAALAWQELVLALPAKPLCNPECKGLCALCGANLNQGGCACVQEDGDARLAVLRGLRVHR